MRGARDPALIKAFAGVIKSARLAAGQTQEQLAEAAKVHATYIGLLENGKRQPSLSSLFAVASGLGLSAETLVSRTRLARRSGT